MIVRTVFCMLWMPRSKRQHSCFWVAYLISKAMEYAIWAQDNKEPAQPRWKVSRVKDRELKRYSYSKPLYIGWKCWGMAFLRRKVTWALWCCGKWNVTLVSGWFGEAQSGSRKTTREAPKPQYFYFFQWEQWNVPLCLLRGWNRLWM